ncbi:MAG: VCBS repeat-containing protein [Alphaproteobacteria bacterium]|nr:VCBS repeat-containing protein [Alphaproteobacteria bacterium]
MKAGISMAALVAIGCGGAGPTSDPTCEPEAWTEPGLLVTLQSEPEKTWLVPVGAGGLGTRQPVFDGVDGEALRQPMLLDIDGDGSLDVVGHRDGVWVARHTTCGWEPTRVSDGGFRVATPIDADGDGDFDLVTFQVDTGVGPLLVNDGDGGFTESPEAYDLGTAFGGYRVLPAQRAADVDGDGHPDFAVVAYDTGGGDQGARIYVVKGNGDGTFQLPEQVGTTPFPSSGLDLGDVDGDGDADLVAGLDDDGDPGQIWLLRNDGTGAFSPAEELVDVAPEVEAQDDGPGFGRVHLVDLDADGGLELVAAWDAESGADQVTIERYGLDPSGVTGPTVLFGPTEGAYTWVGLTHVLP